MNIRFNSLGKGKKNMKWLKRLIIILASLMILTIIAITALNIIVVRQMPNELTGKVVFERGDTAENPAGIYLYDFDSKKTEKLLINGFTELGHISGYSDGSFYCSGRSVDQKTYYILKVKGLQVEAKIPVISSPFAVKKYGDTAIYILDQTVYIANFNQATGTAIIKDVMSNKNSFNTPLYVNGSTIVFARQLENDSAFYTYDNGKEKMICTAKECFGFLNDKEVLIRDTKNRMKCVDIETGKTQFVRHTKYNTPSAISPDGKYMVCVHLPGSYDEYYLVHLKTGVNIIFNDFDNVAGMEWIQ